MDVPGWPPDDAAADDDLLARLGWDDGRQQEFDQLGSTDAVPGRVARVDNVKEKLYYDFYYIKYFSPWLDLLIVFRTIKTMLTGWDAR